jgi:hypothetical protein
MTWFHLKYLNQWKFANTYIDSLSRSLNIYINTLCRSIYIYPKNTINIYAWTLYTPIDDFICDALNPFDIFKSFKINIYLNLDSTSLHEHTPPSTTIYTPIDDYVSCIQRDGLATIWKCTQGAVRVCPMSDDHLLVPFMNIAPDCQYTQENVTCQSNVAGMGLQDLANQANQAEECNSSSPIIFYRWKRALTMEFLYRRL